MARCPNAQFVLKADDDTYVDTFHLEHFLRDHGFHSKSKFLLCNTIENQTVIRVKKSKSYVSPDDYPEETYPRYCTGAAYVTTIETVRAIADNVSQIDNAIHVDDAFVTGIAATRGGETKIPYHHWGMYWMHSHSHEEENIFNPSLPFFSPEIMVAFDLGPEKMRIIHQKTLLCQKHLKNCYQLLWKSDDAKFVRVREEL